MKILQVNTIYGSKSTGRICAEIEDAMTSMGHECYTAYGHGERPSRPCIYRINTPLEYYFHNLMSRLTGLEGYYSWFATRRLLRHIKRLEPDVVHLHNLHGHYLHLPSFFTFLGKAQLPVVMTLHDCWAFTGKCAHYSARGCYRWTDECGSCPALRQYPVSWVFDFTRKMRADKEQWLTALDSLTVIGVSDWVSGEAGHSFLKNRNIVRIYNWIDRDIFRPREDMGLAELGIATGKFTILGVSAGWAPGSARYEDFLQLADLIDDSMQIVLVGRASQPIEHPRIVHIPFVQDKNAMANLFSGADVYVHLSVEDTFGLVIAEAKACGASS